MNFNLLGEFLVSKRRLSSTTLLISGTLAWFFLLQFNISDSFQRFPENPFLEYINPLLLYVCAGISGIFGSLISEKLANRSFFAFWIALGVLSTAVLPFFHQTTVMPVVSILMGVSLGIGLPSSYAYLADSTVVEERARVSGITIFTTFSITILVVLISGIVDFELPTTIVLYALVRSISFLAFAFDKFKETTRVEEETAFTSDYKDFIAYFTPWLMFVLVSILSWNLIPAGTSPAVEMGQALRFIVIAIFSLIAGYTADRFGRKPSVISGLVVLGIGFFILGFDTSETNVMIYLTTSGIAWGSFFTMYLAIPGDLSIHGTRELFYALVIVLPLILLLGLPYLPGLAELTQYSSSFSLILFLIIVLAILPIFRAKETLPESKIRERRMKEYMERVRRLVSENKETE